MRSRLLWRVPAALILAAALGAEAAASPPPPAQNTPPVPDFDAQCVLQGNSVVSGYCAYDAATGTWTFLTPAREAAALAALNHAREAEGLPALRLPSDWDSLTPDEQQFVLVDLERTDRGLPPLVAEAPALDAVALGGAQADADPVATGQWTGYASASNWAGDGQPAVAMYGYMYLDGWGGSVQNTPNVDCTSPGAPGCWAHRDGVLGDYGQSGLLGVATVAGGPAGTGSSAQFYVAYDGPPLAVEYTWAQALAAGAGGGPPPAPAPSALWPFTDMGGDPWAAGAAAVLASAGIVAGTGGGMFSPDAGVQLQEMATFLGRTLGWSAAPSAAPPGTAPWAAGAMAHAEQAGLLPAGVAPAQPLTRLQTVALLVAGLGLPPASAPMPFTDLGGLSAADIQTLTTAVADGLLQGVGAGRLDPAGPVTRAQAVVLLLRALLLQGRQGRGQAGGVGVTAQTLGDGRVLYAVGGMRMLSPSPGADPTVYWQPSSEQMLAESAGFWWTGSAMWTPQTPPSWAVGATGFGAAVAELWTAGQQGVGPALFATTVQVLRYPGETKVLLPGGTSWQSASAAEAADPVLTVAEAL